MDINYDAGAAVIFAFLILSYIIGFSVDSVSKINRWANKAIRLFRADPLKKVFKRYNLCEEINDPETFEGIALQLIQKRFGGSLLENEYRTAIIYYMLREIESKNSFLANFISRISALENMCRNIGLACLINFLIISAYTIYLDKVTIAILALFFLIAGILLLIARDDNRDWFGKVVVRGFVAVNSESFPLTGFPDAELSGTGGRLSGSPAPADNPMMSNPLHTGGDDKSPPSDT